MKFRPNRWRESSLIFGVFPNGSAGPVRTWRGENGTRISIPLNAPPPCRQPDDDRRWQLLAGNNFPSCFFLYLAQPTGVLGGGRSNCGRRVLTGFHRHRPSRNCLESLFGHISVVNRPTDWLLMEDINHIDSRWRRVSCWVTGSCSQTNYEGLSDDITGGKRANCVAVWHLQGWMVVVLQAWTGSHAEVS